MRVAENGRDKGWGERGTAAVIQAQKSGKLTVFVRFLAGAGADLAHLRLGGGGGGGSFDGFLGRGFIAVTCAGGLAFTLTFALRFALALTVTLRITAAAGAAAALAVIVIVIIVIIIFRAVAAVLFLIKALLRSAHTTLLSTTQ